VKVHHTPIGDIIVLPPPLVAAGDQLFWRSGNPDNNGLDPVPAVGGVVDGDIECPNLPQLDGHPDDHQCTECWGSGTVTVPHVVRKVAAITDDEARLSEPTIVIWPGGHVEYFEIDHHPRLGHWTVLSNLPDAEPGGVALIVERAT
jgi:hypothetical protein